jgi:predicted esterase
MTAYAEKRPNSKLILVGYSQGAQIALDILGGAGGILFNGCIEPPIPALDRSTSPGNKSKCAMLTIINICDNSTHS